jgi:hypothetical protein
MMPSYKIKFLVLIVLVIAAVSGCDRDGVSNTDDNPVFDELLKSPQKIEIGNREFVLSAYLWRDFMPISPPGGRKMIAVVKVIASDSSSFPKSIDAERMWIINDDQVWSTKFSETQFDGEYELVKVARDGPKWGPGIEVDVIVELKDGNKKYYLKANNVVINRTD